MDKYVHGRVDALGIYIIILLKNVAENFIRRGLCPLLHGLIKKHYHVDTAQIMYFNLSQYRCLTKLCHII